jgi:hypothetical protein
MGQIAESWILRPRLLNRINTPIANDPSSIFGINNLQFPQAKKISKEKSQMPKGGNHLKTYPKDFKQSA